MLLSLPAFAEGESYAYFFSASCNECEELLDRLISEFSDQLGVYDIDREENLSRLFEILEERSLEATAFPVLLTPDRSLSGFEEIRIFLEGNREAGADS